MASMTGFICQNLVADQVYAVFPLVREVVSGLDLKSWNRMARRLVNARRAAHEGIRVVLPLPRRLPCGLFLYHRSGAWPHPGGRTPDRGGRARP